jgi:hypothetical protein
MSYKYSKSRTTALGPQTFMNKVSTGLVSASVIMVDSKILNRISISSSFYLNHSNYFIGVDTVNATGSVVVYLPHASGSVAGRTYMVKDECGNCNNNLIVIEPTNGDTIDGLNSVTLDSPYASLHVYTDGISRWFIY